MTDNKINENISKTFSDEPSQVVLSIPEASKILIFENVKYKSQRRV